MSFAIEFPEPEENIIVETELMRRTVLRTMAVHPGGACVIWTGPSRNGKSSTGRWMVRKIEEAYHTSRHAFHAVHYEVGPINKPDGKDMARGIRSLYHATIGRLTDNSQRPLPTEELAEQLVHGLMAKNIQMVLVDEAGLLSLDAIRGMMLARNVAERIGWRLTLVFIGMDDLPLVVKRLPQVDRRIHEWCYFKPYDVKETWQLLAALHPHFASLNPRDPSHLAQVQFVHHAYGGLPGMIVPFLRRLSGRERAGIPIDYTLLQAVHYLTVRDEQLSLEDSESGKKSAFDHSELRQSPDEDGGDRFSGPGSNDRKKK